MNLMPDLGILAGGQGSRLHGVDKGLLTIGSTNFVSLLLTDLAAETKKIIINCNRNIHYYQQLADEVVTDLSEPSSDAPNSASSAPPVGGAPPGPALATKRFSGPLHGLLRLLTHANGDYLLLAPCDTPLLGAEYAKRMIATLNSNDSPLPSQNVDNGRDTIVAAHDGDRVQPLHLLLPVSVKGSLNDFLGSGQRKVSHWLATITIGREKFDGLSSQKFLDHKRANDRSHHHYRLRLCDFSDSPERFLNINRQKDYDALQQQFMP